MKRSSKIRNGKTPLSTTVCRIAKEIIVNRNRYIGTNR